jgi:hypothetical protein
MFGVDPVDSDFKYLFVSPKGLVVIAEIINYSNDKKWQPHYCTLLLSLI